MANGSLTLRDVRRMLEGVVPPAMCTVSADGVPHVNILSQAEFIDDEHIALSFQFFNRSRANVLATGRAALSVDDPYTGSGVVMQLQYLRTDKSGPAFERIRAKLAGIASHTGMENVFKLQGADVYRVLELRPVPGRRDLPGVLPRCDVAAGARALSQRVAACSDLPAMLDTFMDGLAVDLRIDHAMLWIVEPSRHCMALLASRGYEVSGLGAELPLGEGLAGVAMREGVPVRIGHMTKMYTYGRAVGTQARSLGLGDLLNAEIPLPGLESPRSQVAVPMIVRGQTAGVLFAESTHDQFFSYDDEDALQLLCSQLGVTMALLQTIEAQVEPPPAAAAAPAPEGPPVQVRRFERDNSIFIDSDYLIKGLAGAIIWKIVGEYARTGRSDFTNRELRLSADLPLPASQDNLEARLHLLQRRLQERGSPLQIKRTARGCFRLHVERPLLLQQEI